MSSKGRRRATRVPSGGDGGHREWWRQEAERFNLHGPRVLHALAAAQATPATGEGAYDADPGGAFRGSIRPQHFVGKCAPASSVAPTPLERHIPLLTSPRCVRMHSTKLAGNNRAHYSARRERRNRGRGAIHGHRGVWIGENVAPQVPQGLDSLPTAMLPIQLFSAASACRMKPWGQQQALYFIVLHSNVAPLARRVAALSR